MNRQDAKDAKRREPSQEIDRLAYEVIGAAIEVHRVLGPGFLELIYHVLIVELKAVEKLAPIHEAQVMSYLKTTKLPLALPINFNVPVLKEGIKRIILSS